MKVLIACEFSGVVRRAFRARGHEVWSCDLLPAEDAPPGGHLQCDVRRILDGCDWDLMIGHPPCTYLTAAGARWMRKRLPEMEQAIDFFQALLFAPIPKIALENPVGVLTRAVRAPDQIIQPWQYGHGECKATCLWLVGLPTLKPTAIVEGREHRTHLAPDSRGRAMNRSRTLAGIADAMAEQWGAAA